ncbi:MAG TPA: delta-60 repeat domain-containing protein [Polyangiaceae bacterium]
MPRSTRLLVASFSSIAVLGLAACTSILGDFDVAPNGVDNDASNPGDGSPGTDGAPTDGSSGEGAAPGTYLLSADSIVFVKAGATATVAVKLDRNAFDAAVDVTVTGLPAGVTASPLTVAAGATTGTLTLTAAAAAVVGAEAKASVASTSGTVTAPAAVVDVAVSGPTGTLDPSFPAALPYGAGLGTIQDAVLQPDGDVVLFGTFHQAAGDAPSLVMRVHPDMTVDSTFTLGAIATNASASPIGTAVAGLLQADGKIVVAWTEGASSKLNISRLTASGTLDPTFGNPSTSTVSTSGTFPTTSPEVVGLDIDKNGSIVYGQMLDSSTVQAWRFTSAGVADSTLGVLGNYGNKTFTKAEPVLQLGTINAIFPQTDGTYYFLGYGTGEPGLSMDTLARTTSGFVLDTTFGPSSGKLGWETGNGKFNINESLQIGNTIYSTGITAASCTSNVTYCVASWTLSAGDAVGNGPICPTTTTGLGCNDTSIRIAKGPGTTIITAGYSTFLGGAVVARYTTSPLAVDTSFGNAGVGRLTKSTGASDIYPVAVLTTAQGTTLVFNHDPSKAIQRFWP